MGADASTAPLGSSKTKKQVPIFHQMLIVIHGSRKSGKTSLLRRMNGANINPQYTPTKFMQASEIIWHPIGYPSEAIKIIVWDVVDKAIDSNPQTQRTKQLPDATTVDTFSRADGIIVIYDPRFEESIQYARDILDKAPQEKPILLVMNFSDTFDSSPIIPPQIEPYTNSFFHLMASMKTNQGLAELANWLDLPLNVSLSKIYELRMKESEKRLHELLEEFHQTGFTEETLQNVAQPKEEKDFWADKDSKFGLGPAEVPADFFMDDDENDAKTRRNLEKLKQKLNITEIDEEEEIDEQLKAQKLKKKPQILSKEQIANNAKNQKTIQDESEDSYEDDESDKITQNQQEQVMPQINFDIPVVAENTNTFFDDDLNDEDELKHKIDLESHEEEEDKPKTKKSKILPKVKQPQITIKPASQTKPSKEIPKNDLIDTSLALEAANNSQFTTGFDNKNKKQNQNDKTFPSFENETPVNSSLSNNEKSNQNDMTFPSFENETPVNSSLSNNEKSKQNDVAFPSFENETPVNSSLSDNEKQNQNDVAFPSFENEIDGDQKQSNIDDSEIKQIDTVNVDENQTKERELTNQNEINLPTSEINKSSTNEIGNVDLTFPSFGNDDNFFSNDDDQMELNNQNESTNENESTLNLSQENKLQSNKELTTESNKIELNNETQEITTQDKQQIESNNDNKEFEINKDNEIQSNSTPNPESKLNTTSDFTIESPKENESKIEITSNQTEISSQFDVQKDNSNEIQIPNLFNDSHQNDDFFDDNDDNIHPPEIQQKPNDLSEKEIDLNTNQSNPIDSIQLNINDENFFAKETPNDQLPTENKTDTKSDLINMPKPPPIDFSSSFLSEQKKPIATSPSPSNQPTTSDLDDIINAVRRQEAERAEKARKDAALLEAMKRQEAMKSPQFAASQLQHQNEYGSIITGSSEMNSNGQNSPVASEYEAFGDYQTFDDAPRTSKKKHRPHGNHQRKHRSSKRSTKEDDNQVQQEGNENGDPYLSFD